MLLQMKQVPAVGELRSEKTIWLRDIIRQNFKLGSDLQRFHQAPFDVRFDIYKTSSSCLKSGSMDTAV